MKRFLSLMLAVVMMLSLSVSAFANEKENIKPLLNRDLKIIYDGEFRTFTDVNGNIVYPLSYNDTTYLPVRAISNLINLPISWDSTTYSVVLGGDAKIEPAADPIGEAKTGKETVSAILNKSLNVTYYGEVQTFTDVNGTVVYPISYNDTTYLPVRAISNLVDLYIEFDAATYSVVLTDGTTVEIPVTPPSTPVPETGFERGVWDGNFYINNFAHLDCTVDDGHTIAKDDAQIAEFISSDDDSIIYDMVVQNDADLTTTIVHFVNFSEVENKELITSEMYAEAILKSFYEQGDSAELLSSGLTNICDNEYYSMSLLIDGEVYNDYFIRKVGDDYICCIIILGESPDNLMRALSHFGQ
ncbi:MAG: hypothetical protein IKV63_04245 [Clostridia bacterium]|nr:hypothetical protein [Clostridia bacterium]